MTLGNLLKKIVDKLTLRTVTGYTVASGYTVNYMVAERCGNLVHLCFSLYSPAATSSYVTVITGLPKPNHEEYVNGSVIGTYSAINCQAFLDTNGNLFVKFNTAINSFYDILYFVGGVTKWLLSSANLRRCFA